MSILERIPQLACPACKGQLEYKGALYCKSCDKSYEIHNGIPQMVGEDMLKFAKEIAVQDGVAVEYEDKRYQVPFAKKYHNWWTDQMLSRVQTGGRILDNGCGIGGNASCFAARGGNSISGDKCLVAVNSAENDCQSQRTLFRET